MGINIKILDIKAGSSYNETVYDQWIEVRLPTGDPMTLFDDKILLSEETINAEIKADIKPVFNVSEISPDSGCEYGVEIVNTDSGTDHIYRGQIENVQSSESNSSKKTTFELNIGFGTVRFSVGSSRNIGLSVGDEILLPAFRSDLVRLDDN
ncbi:hypothetical protein PM023_16920 [Halorubrum ezzemoulense]|uniref:hypothetical protein n=1 Tax=Halorubrum ezzemoulense TaxID=337243 RepID=UPI00232F77B0|nr:hypothetical protein [Halorubrum ezzemoulense]MDB2226320.1 hypothetical protein [Halorubrum ezzemoulense]